MPNTTPLQKVNQVRFFGHEYIEIISPELIIKIILQSELLIEKCEACDS